jgi:hypothetical protein
MNFQASFTTAIVLFVTCMVACSKDQGGTTSLDCSAVTNKSFAADIDPIIQSTCNVPSCHMAGSVNGPGPLTNYNQVFSARSEIRAAIASGLMPQNGSLTTAQRNSILCWIDSGAPNN